MSYNAPVSQTDLQAYADGQLSPMRRREVEEYLKKNPEMASMIEDYKNINDAVHKYFDPILEEPLPAQITVPVHSNRLKLLRVAAVSSWLALGGVIGWQLHPATVTLTTVDMLTAHLVKPAAFAHVIYTPEVRHPVEVSGKEHEHMVKWLSKRLKTMLQIPDLRDHGYELVGGRLLPSTDRMAAQFMYQRSDGVRITLYNRRGVWGNKATSFQFTKEKDTAVFYWIDGPLGFALVGNLSKRDLLKISESVYQQLN